MAGLPKLGIIEGKEGGASNCRFSEGLGQDDTGRHGTKKVF